MSRCGILSAKLSVIVSGLWGNVKHEVSNAIRESNKDRLQILQGFSTEIRKKLLVALFTDLFGHQHVTLQKWAALTGQSAQVDTGYIAQFVASVVLGQPGQGFRGKGDDLVDGSEVKGAANISGVDRPRWNHSFGTVGDDRSRRAKGLPTKAEVYLASPNLFYLLVDRVMGVGSPAPIRVRGWCINSLKDEAWINLIATWEKKREIDGDATRYNFQLHPPVGYDDNVVVNTLGNLDFEDVLIFDARIDLADPRDPKVSWAVDLKDFVSPVVGRTKALPYQGPKARPSRLTSAADLVADIAVLPSLFPGILDPAEEEIIEAASVQEAATSAVVEDA